MRRLKTKSNFLYQPIATTIRATFYSNLKDEVFDCEIRAPVEPFPRKSRDFTRKFGIRKFLGFSPRDPEKLPRFFYRFFNSSFSFLLRSVYTLKYQSPKKCVRALKCTKLFLRLYSREFCERVIQ